MIVSWLVTLFITFIIIVDVFLRYVLNKPLPATWEISEILMPYIVFLAFAYALKKGSHIRVSLLTDSLPPKAQLGCEILSNLIGFIMCALMTYWSWLRFWESFMIREEIIAAVHLPWWFGKFAMPIGMGVFAIRYLTLLSINFIQPNRSLGGL